MTYKFQNLLGSPKVLLGYQIKALRMCTGILVNLIFAQAKYWIYPIVDVFKMWTP